MNFRIHTNEPFEVEGGSSSVVVANGIFGTTFSIFDLWCRPWGVARLLCHAPIPRKRSGSTSTSCCSDLWARKESLSLTQSNLISCVNLYDRP